MLAVVIIGVLLDSHDGRSQEPDDLARIVASGECPSDLSTYTRINENERCNPSNRNSDACDHRFTAPSKPWQACYAEISACRKRVQDENSKIQAYNSFIYKCRGDANRKAESSPSGTPDPASSAEPDRTPISDDEPASARASQAAGPSTAPPTDRTAAPNHPVTQRASCACTARRGQDFYYSRTFIEPRGTKHCIGARADHFRNYIVSTMRVSPTQVACIAGTTMQETHDVHRRITKSGNDMGHRMIDMKYGGDNILGTPSVVKWKKDPSPSNAAKPSAARGAGSVGCANAYGGPRAAPGQFVCSNRGELIACRCSGGGCRLVSTGAFQCTRPGALIR